MLTTLRQRDFAVLLASLLQGIAVGFLLVVSVPGWLWVVYPVAVWRELGEGLRVVRRERPIAVLFAVVGFMTFGGTMLDPLYPAFGHDVLGGGPAVYGWLLTAMAVGGLLGGVAIGQLGERVLPGKLVGWGSIAAGLLLLVQFNARWLPLVLPVAVVVGSPSAASPIGTQTLIQTRTEDAARGRVLGLWGASGGLLSLAGAGVGGALAAVVGLMPMLDVASGLTLLAGVVALVALSSPSP